MRYFFVFPVGLAIFVGLALPFAVADAGFLGR